MPELLTDDEVRAGLAELPGWERDGDAIVTRVQHPSFPAAIAWVVRVGFLAEAMDHHPDLEIRWRTVTVRCSTHSAGGVTALDLELARRIGDTHP
jgi:4a-hydroxytetrahydrobiopterin dehydratase